MKYQSAVASIILALLIATLNPGCKNQSEPGREVSDSLIVALPPVLTYQFLGPLTIRFRVLRGAPVEYIVSRIIYLSKDSAYSVNSKSLPAIMINGANLYASVDTSITVDREFLTYYFNNSSFVRISEGDQWMVSYTAFLNDGSVVPNRGMSAVVYDNPMAGKFRDHVVCHSPSSGSYPDDILVDTIMVKNLKEPGSINCSTTDFALWKSAIEILQLWDKDSVSFEAVFWDYSVTPGDPYDPSRVCHFDRKSGTINLYYYYTTNTGLRFFEETFTPAE